jgi:Prophage tail length tape measure protein
MVNVINNIVIRGSAEGVAQVEKAVRDLASGMEDLEVASGKQAKATLSVETALKRLQNQIDPTYRATLALQKAQTTLDQARAQGLISLERQNALMQLASKYHDTVTTAGNNQRGMWRALGREISLVSPELAGVTQVFGGAAVGMGRLGPIITGVALAIAGLVKSLTDFAANETALRQMSNAIALVGGSSGVTAQSLKDMAKAMADTGTVTKDAVVEAQKALITFRDLGPGTFGPALEAARKLSQTGLMTMAEAAKALGAALNDPVNATQELAKANIQLDLATQQQITNLARRGDFWKAQQLLLKAINEQTKGLKDNSDTLEGSWNKFTNTLKTSSSDLGALIADFTNLKGILDSISGGVSAVKSGLKGLQEGQFDVATDMLGNPVIVPKGTLPGAGISGAIGGAGAGPRPLTFAERFAPAAGLPPAGALPPPPGMSAEDFQKVTKALEEETMATRIQAETTKMGAAEAQRYTIVETQKQRAILAGKPLTDDQIAQIEKQADETASLTRAIQESAIAFQIRLQTMQATGRLTAEEAQIVQQLVPLYGQNIPAALGSAEAAQIKFNNAVKQAQELAGEFINTFVSGLVKGEGLVKSLAAAVSGLGASITQAASRQLGTSIIGGAAGTTAGGALGSGIGGLVGAGGLGLTGMSASLATGGIGLAIGAGLSLIGNLFNKNAEAEKQQAEATKQATQAILDSQKALDGLVNGLRDLNDVAGPVTKQIQSAKNQLDQVGQAGQQGIIQIANAFHAGNITFAQGVAAINDINKAMDEANAQFREFAQRTIEDARTALREAGKPALSPIQQQIKEFQKQADDLIEAMKRMGVSAEEAAKAVGQDLAQAMDNLRASTEQDLQRRTRELTGQGFINQALDLRQQINDAKALGVSEQTLADFTRAQGQAIVDQFKLTGAAFIKFIAQFPELIGFVHEYDAALSVVKRSTEELTRASQSLDDRMLAATTDANTLEGALVLFDRRALREREEEIRAGGENLVQLESVQAAERLQIIRQFNEQSIELERERVDQLNSFARDIATYVNSLFAGPESALSPSGRLTQAQTAFTNQLALANLGNTDALATITKFAEDYRQAAQAFFGSGTQYQTILGQISSALLAIPAVAESPDPVVQALINTVTPAIQGTTTAVGGTTGAVNSQTSTQSAEALTQANLLTAANSLSTSANTLSTSANSLLTSANNLTTSTNNILTAIQGLQTTANSTLDAINTTVAILNSINNNDDQIKTSTSQLPAMKTDLDSINSHTSHMFAPSGSVNFNLAQGGFVGGPGGGAVEYRLASGGGVGTDTVPAWLTPGEFVINRDVAQRNRDWLPAFNAGGFVGPTGTQNTWARIESLLAQIVALEAQGNEMIGHNTAATMGQTREARFASRKRYN